MKASDTSGVPSSLVHDLRGPLITLEGFLGEVDEALTELEKLIGDGAPEGVVAERLAALLVDDIRPCLAFVDAAGASLHERIDALRPSPADVDDG